MKVTIWSNNVGHQIRSQQVFINTMYTLDTLTAVAVQGTPFPRMSECPDEVKHVNAREPTIPKKIGKNKRAKNICADNLHPLSLVHTFFLSNRFYLVFVADFTRCVVFCCDNHFLIFDFVDNICCHTETKSQCHGTRKPSASLSTWSNIFFEVNA